MTTPSAAPTNRRRFLGSSAAIAAWAVTGCDRQGEVATSAKPSTARARVPLRLTMVGDTRDAETITLGWKAVSEQPLEIHLISLDRAAPDQLPTAALDRGNQTDVLILPFAIIPQAVERKLLSPWSDDEFTTAEQTLGEVLPAARNAAARFASQIVGIPLGTSQPFLLSAEEIEGAESWEAYDRLVDGWSGAASEPTAPGWAGSMFLWRSAAERQWLFERDSFQPLIASESYLRALELMVQTCSRYQRQQQSPQQVWDGVKSAELRGGIGFPELRTDEQDGVMFLHSLPGQIEGSRVLLDLFSPVAALAASCRQTAVAKQFMLWLSGGEGSQSVRRQIRAMNDVRQLEVAGSATSGSIASYDQRLRERLNNVVTMPTLQLLEAGEYYGVLDRQVIRALNKETSAQEALEAVAQQWQAITDRVGSETQLRVWRQAQGMRG